MPQSVFEPLSETRDDTVPSLPTLESVTRIVSSYLTNHQVPAEKLPGLILSVSEALSAQGNVQAGEPVAKASPMSAAAIQKTISHDTILCLECGTDFRSLKRHIGNKHDLTPHEYRLRWSLPQDYPMTAPGYAARRSDIAKTMGLGRKK